MKTEVQIELTPRGARQRNFTTRTAIASLARATATISAVAGDGPKLVAKDSSDIIRPFRVNVPKAALADLRRRLAATR